MALGAALLQVGSGPWTNTVACIHCSLRVLFGEADHQLVSDLLASHWADDHHITEWRDKAADARDRLWRMRPDVLEDLMKLVEANRRPRTG